MTALHVEHGVATDAWGVQLRRWYHAHARGLFARDVERAMLAASHPPASEVGVLGVAGVGKSSLLNALIAPGIQLLPAGGVGALTGTEIRIACAREPQLSVRYREAGYHSGVRRWRASSDRGELFRMIRLHAAGAETQRCERVEIGWPSPFLGSLSGLLDLPGLGMIHDPHAERTIDWLAHARSVLLVVDRAGLPETIVYALRGSGFLERWRTGDAQLAIAITKIDLVADDLRRGAGGTSASWLTHYLTSCHQAMMQLRVQLATVLSQTAGWRGDRAAIQRAAARTPIVPTSSRECHRLYTADELDRPRVRSPSTTGIPEAQRVIRAMNRLESPLARAIDQAIVQAFEARADSRTDDLHERWTAFLEEAT
jgi:hypothetical protein